ncbi:MAG: PEP-CTERM sorting domain-containing protein [Cyanobacteria bacterium P01_F01_bin.153]
MSFLSRYSRNLNGTLNGCAIALAVAGAFAIAQPASATTFVFDWDRNTDGSDPSQGSWCAPNCFKDKDDPIWYNNRVGNYDNIFARYDDQSGDLTWSSTFSAYDDKLPEGAWLVINNGQNPRSDGKDNAIFYLDGITGRLTAYKYNDENNSASWQQEQFLQSWDNAVSLVDDGNGNRTLGFDINVAALNALTGVSTGGEEWLGAQFDEHIGIWYHAVDNFSATYDEETKELTSFSGYGSWYDTGGYIDTEIESVPEPSVGLLGLAAFGLMIKRRRQGNVA